MRQLECPIQYEAMTGGWECPKCGRSGPFDDKAEWRKTI